MSYAVTVTAEGYIDFPRYTPVADVCRFDLFLLGQYELEDYLTSRDDKRPIFMPRRKLHRMPVLIERRALLAYKSIVEFSLCHRILTLVEQDECLSVSLNGVVLLRCYKAIRSLEFLVAAATNDLLVSFLDVSFPPGSDPDRFLCVST